MGLPGAYHPGKSLHFPSLLQLSLPGKPGHRFDRCHPQVDSKGVGHMEKEQRDRLKNKLLLGFICLNLVIITLIVADRLAGDNPPMPGFYRQTVPTENLSASSQTEKSPSPSTTATGSDEVQDGDDPVTIQKSYPTPTIDWDALEQDQ